MCCESGPRLCGMRRGEGACHPPRRVSSPLLSSPRRAAPAEGGYSCSLPITALSEPFKNHRQRSCLLRAIGVQ
jgi:hypothetical protein